MVLKKAGYSLTVHHLDHDATNNHETNLVTLCRDCHEVEHGRG